MIGSEMQILPSPSQQVHAKRIMNEALAMANSNSLTSDSHIVNMPDVVHFNY